MQLGFVGLGKMGLNMVTRLVARRPRGRRVRSQRRRGRRARDGAGARGVASLEALVAALAPPRAVWVMVPAGAPTESTVAALGALLVARRRRSSTAATRTSTTTCGAPRRSARSGIHYVDAGTSGGIWGLQEGYCLMVGGDADVCRRLEPIFLHAGAAGRLPARRRPRRRPLREDGPQRHRVRPDAGVRRRLRADARERLPDRPRARSPRCGCTAASCARGCSS